VASSTRFLPRCSRPAAVERAGQGIATGTGQKILVSLAIGEQVEHVDDARRTLGFARQFDPAQVDRASRKSPV
jgi:hypothetical protein